MKYQFFNIFLYAASILPLAGTSLQACNRPETSNNFIFPASKGHPLAIRVISYNVRGESAIDQSHGNAWDVRKYKIQYLLQSYQPDIIGLQGVRTSYMPDIRLLFSEYTCIAFDTSKEDKDVILLVRTDRFIVEDQGYFWLTDDPLMRGIPEKASWGGRSPRIVVCARLHDRCTDKKIVVLCTHFDSAGMESRVAAAEVLINQASRIAGDVPLVLAGDFNFILTTPEISAKSHQAYLHIASNIGLRDVRDISKMHYGPDGTWIGWPYDKYAAPFGAVGERLDNIFVRYCAVLMDGVLNLKVDFSRCDLISPHNEQFRNYAYPSDHLPVIADLLLQQ